MRDIRARYPDLDDFIGSEFIQDPDDHRSLREVTNDFIRTREPRSVLSVATDIRRFLRDQHNDIDAAFDGFNPEIYPPGMGYTVAEFLTEIAHLLEQASSKSRDS